MLISNPSDLVLSEFPRLFELGNLSLKIYMTYAALQLRNEQILDAVLAARRTDLTTLVHVENGDMLTWMTKKLEEKLLYAPKHHVTSRPQVLEAEATN